MKKKAKKEKPPLAAEKFYRIDIEFTRPNHSQWVYLVFMEEVAEKDVAKQCSKFKAAGIGGRLVLLDGTPAGRVVEQWGSVERVAKAEELEKKALTR